MKKWTVFLLSILIVCLLAVPCYADKKTVGVETVRNVAGENGSAAVQILQDQLTAAVQGSAAYRLQNAAAGEGAMYVISTTITDVGDYDAKGDREKIMALIKRSMGRETNPDGTPLSAADREAATKELKEISANPIGFKLTLDVRLVDAAGGQNIFAGSLTGDKTGDTREKAIYNASREAAKKILQALEDAAPAGTTPTPAVKAAVPVPVPQKMQPAPVSGTAFRGVIGDMGGDNIYIDQGTASGLQAGEFLDIYRVDGDVMINGKAVGKKEIKIGRAKVLEVLPEYSVCLITAHTQDVKVNDVVKRPLA